jgi:hypothetical protein
MSGDVHVLADATEQGRLEWSGLLLMRCGEVASIDDASGDANLEFRLAPDARAATCPGCMGD